MPAKEISPTILHTAEKLPVQPQPWTHELSSVRGKFLDRLQIPENDPVVIETLDRLNKVYFDYYLPSNYPPHEYAFIVHPRDPIENDIQRQFPAFCPDFLPSDTITEIFESLPPMILGEYTGLQNSQGKNINGWVISAPITVQGTFLNGREGMMAARHKALQTAQFAQKQLGVKIVGLGETLGSLTKFGISIEDAIPELKVTTGHAYTVQLVGQVLKKGASSLGLDMKDSTLAIVGAGGAIGSSAAQLLSSDVKKIILHDLGPQFSRIQNIASRIDNENFEITSDNNRLREADLIVAATTNPFPFITRECVKPGTIIVDDSQPVNMTREEAFASKALLLHPIAQIPDGVSRTFDFSLPDLCDFSCAAEVMALASTGEYHMRTIGRLEDIDQVQNVTGLTQQTGITVAPLQSFGQLIPEDYIRSLQSYIG